MHLLWMFMGYSTPYTLFAGAGEVVGGLLLFFRRTTTLGALVTAAVMLQVVMLDYSYNVSVKIESAHLLLMALILAMPDLRRLVNVLVLNRATVPADLGRAPTSPRMRMLAIGLKSLSSYLPSAVATKDSWGAYRQQQESRRIPIYGVYNVEEFRLNGQVMPPLTTDSVRWSKAIFDSRTYASFMLMNGAMRSFSVKYDFDKHTMTAGTPNPRDSSTLSYSQPDAKHMILTGQVLGRHHCRETHEDRRNQIAAAAVQISVAGMRIRTPFVFAVVITLAVPGASPSVPRGTVSRRAALHADANDQRTAAGRMVDGELRVDLDIVDITWSPRGPSGPLVPAVGFAERGHAPQVPGPLLRMRAGIPVRISVRNTLTRAVRVRGLSDRVPGDTAVNGLPGWSASFASNSTWSTSPGRRAGRTARSSPLSDSPSEATHRRCRGRCCGCAPVFRCVSPFATHSRERCASAA